MSIVFSGIKMATGIVAELGVGVMIGEATMRLIPETASKAVKVCCITGGAMGAGAAGRAVHKFSDDMFDTIAEIPKEYKKNKAEKKELEEFKKKMIEMKKEVEEKEKK